MSDIRFMEMGKSLYTRPFFKKALRKEGYRYYINDAEFILYNGESSKLGNQPFITTPKGAKFIKENIAVDENKKPCKWKLTK